MLAPRRPTGSAVERGRHEAELVRRRYLAVDPDNRLVADSLEAEWNERLRDLARAQDEAERAREQVAGALSEEQRAKVGALADFPIGLDPAAALEDLGDRGF